MTGAELVTKLENMTDDVLDVDFANQLTNDAKDEVEAMVVWEMLKKAAQYVVPQGYSHGTVLGALPSDFALDRSLIEVNSVVPYSKVLIDDLAEQQYNPRGYFLDLGGNALHLSGSNHGAKTVQLNYARFSPTIEEGTSWVFPERFHRVLPLKMAELYYLSDAPDKSRSYNQEWAVQFERALKQMELWNDALKLTGRRPARGRARQTPLNVI